MYFLTTTDSLKVILADSTVTEQVEMEVADQGQHIGHAAGYIQQTKFQQHDAGIGSPVLEIADLLQFFIGGPAIPSIFVGRA